MWRLGSSIKNLMNAQIYVYPYAGVEEEVVTSVGLLASDGYLLP